jgi:hypothetical protein
MDAYTLDKAVWTDDDFDVMGWHDATIWSMLADTEAFEFMLDLDYIFKWVHPAEGEQYFTFWVAPVTMVFENVHAVKIDIESQQGSIEVADFHREDFQPTPNGKLTDNLYRFECQEGEISLRASSYRMYVRRSPVLLTGQSAGLEERNGISFGRTLDAG